MTTNKPSKTVRFEALASMNKRINKLNMTIEELLNTTITSLEDDSEITEAIDFSKGVPTLEKGTYRNVSSMLKARYKKLGGWIDATHGDWLDVKEMELFWTNETEDDRLIGIIQNVKASIKNWEDHAAGLFAPNRISIFAASEATDEIICLVWFDSTEEPELWVYDCNGESRYKDLASYLQAYIDDDVSACKNKWKLAEIQL